MSVKKLDSFKKVLSPSLGHMHVFYYEANFNLPKVWFGVLYRSEGVWILNYSLQQ